MKIRSSFVSNSSSASFVVVLSEYNFDENGIEIVLSKDDELLLKKFGFKYMKGNWQTCLNYSSPLRKTNSFKINDEVCMYMDCTCNEDEIYNFLFQNHIPFKAYCSNDIQLWIYDGKSDYYEIFVNYGKLFEMYGHDRKIFNKLYFNDSIPYEKVSLIDKRCDSSAGYLINQFSDALKKAGKKAKEFFTEDELKKISNFILNIASDEIRKLEKNKNE